MSQVEGHSLAAQERLLAELCKSRGWTAIQVYRKEGSIRLWIRSVVIVFARAGTRGEIVGERDRERSHHRRSTQAHRWHSNRGGRQVVAR
jgi:hypothetical protein